MRRKEYEEKIRVCIEQDGLDLYYHFIVLTTMEIDDSKLNDFIDHVTTAAENF